MKNPLAVAHQDNKRLFTVNSLGEQLSPNDLVTFCRKVPQHVGSKVIKPELIEKAAANRPFDEYAAFIRTAETLNPQKIIEAVESFMNGQYHNLHGAGISFSLMNELDDVAERKVIDELASKFKKLEMEGQSLSINEEYGRFKGMRNCFRIMQKNNMLKADSILPIEYLAELLMAAPVWFIHGKEKLPDLTKKNDPDIDHACKYFCSQLPNQVAADLYQMYNRRTRPLSHFKGRDIVPCHLMGIIAEAKTVFDYVAIATPYHDQASTEWADPAWQRNIDPYLLGFMVGIPVMFLLGRWSGTGLFPLFLDMVADTVEHMRSHIDMLNNFEDPYWVIKKELDPDDWIGDGAEIRNSANAIIKAFDHGNLFKLLHSPA